MKIKDRIKPKTPALPKGAYPGVCVGVIDLGEQYSELYKNYSNKVMFIWAFPTKLTKEDGKDVEIQLSRTFNITTKKGSKFRDFLESWNGVTYSDEDFSNLELKNQLGTKNLIGVTISETGEYSNVSTIMDVPEGIQPFESKTPFIYWDMDDWDDDRFQALPEFAQEHIKKSTQYQKEHAPMKTIEPEAGEEDLCTGPSESQGVPF